jgi:hypothetical protein
MSNISQPSIPYKQRLNTSIDIELSDVLDLHGKNLSLDINCHHIGTIQSFNSSNQTASVSINYTKTFYVLNTITNTYDQQPSTYPVILECPVIFLGGGNSHLTFPIKIGDECLILFNDRDIDNWFVGGAGSQVNTPRLHSFSDAVVLVGIRSMPKALSSFDTNHAAISASTGELGVNITNGKALISNNGVTLKNALEDLITALTGFCAACSSSSDTTLVSAVAALSTALTTTVNPVIVGLLE